MFPTLNIKNHQPQVYAKKGVVHISRSQSRQIALNFIEAVKANPNEAWAFVSKVYSSSLDLNELREVFLSSLTSVKWVTMATYAATPKNCLTRSLYVEDPARNIRRLLHFRMIKEPDKNGIWKICKVEQEIQPWK
ncbi:MAG: hypothetical protein FWC78_02780 [Defluviitaleaceae bacterium]|nr:hypothetical protein [Defluviitaleaceae bacterium]